MSYYDIKVKFKNGDIYTLESSVHISKISTVVPEWETIYALNGEIFTELSSCSKIKENLKS